jgi:hypothetical protein
VGRALLGALLAVVLYAVFAHGATSHPHDARVQVALCAVALAVVAIVLWRGAPLGGSPAAWTGLALLGAFAAWTALTLAWSAAPSDTWTELNRAATYVLVVGLGLVAASWYPDAVRHAALGFAGVAFVVALYALGGKVAPGLHAGPVDLNQTVVLARLRAPLEYWNALGLFLALALPVVLRLVVDETRPRRWRLAALGALPVYIVTLALTFSRGGVIAAVVAVAVTVVLAGSGLRTLMYLGLALAASAAPMVLGFTADDLTGNRVALSDRTGEGLLLGLLLVVSIALLVAVGRFVLSAEERTPASPARSRRIGRALLGALGVVALAGVVAMAASDRGLTGTVSHQWKTFRSVHEAPGQFDPGRLASSNAGNRWVWWSEAVGAWSDRPLEGHGAGSFGAVHREYRTNALDVRQPHSVPLQFLAETGLVGFVLAFGGLLALFAGALGAVRRMLPGPERGLAAALLGASAGWLVHGFYDWDWDIPGVTIPALLFLGLLAARGGMDRAVRPVGRLGGPSPVARAAALGAAALALGTLALSAILPSWAASITDAALGSVTRTDSPAALERAETEADLASRLDTLSVEPLLAAASFAQRRGRAGQARKYLVDAVRRQPSSVPAWVELARLELQRGDLANVPIALRRVRELDPRNGVVPRLIAVQVLTTVPPAGSATATGTPLVAIVGRTRSTAQALKRQYEAAGLPVPPDVARIAAQPPPR